MRRQTPQLKNGQRPGRHSAEADAQLASEHGKGSRGIGDTRIKRQKVPLHTDRDGRGPDPGGPARQRGRGRQEPRRPPPGAHAGQPARGQPGGASQVRALCPDDPAAAARGAHSEEPEIRVRAETSSQASAAALLAFADTRERPRRPPAGGG